DVANSEQYVQTLIDARIPTPDIRTDTSLLMSNLRKKGTITSFTNSLENISFDTGGIAVTQAPFHPISTSGVEESLYILGIPLEHTRWLMHIGSGRPGVWGQFTQDADDVAKNLMSALFVDS
ncbi:MAG TPA: hypothetical protein VKR58_09240, partial [Aquella sp.]|nr:hypothetical protein [Aquella sp.]